MADFVIYLEATVQDDYQISADNETEAIKAAKGIFRDMYGLPEFWIDVVDVFEED